MKNIQKLHEYNVYTVYNQILLNIKKFNFGDKTIIRGGICLNQNQKDLINLSTFNRFYPEGLGKMDNLTYNHINYDTFSFDMEFNEIAENYVLTALKLTVDKLYQKRNGRDKKGRFVKI